MSAEGIFRSWRNGFSPSILFPKRGGDVPGGRDLLLLDVKTPNRSEIFSFSNSNWKCFDHGDLFEKQIEPHLRNIDPYKAYQEQMKLFGEGDARATEIYASAYEQDSEFYSFLRRLQTYEQLFERKTTILLDSDSELLKYFKGPRASNK